MSYRKSFVMLALSAICGHGYAQTEAPRYRFERVPTESPTAVATGDASDLNDAGAVVGRRAIDSDLFAFKWHDGNVKLLPQDTEGNAAQLHLNDRFDVIMSVSSEATGERNLLVLSDGRTVQINPLPGDSDLDLISLNNRRQVLASSVGGASPSGRQPMIWHRGRATPLDALPDSYSVTALNLNDRGVAIGYSSRAPGEINADQRAVLWEAGSVMELPLPDEAIGSRGRDVNNRGQAIFTAHFEQGGGQGEPLHPTAVSYVWRQGHLQALPLLPIGQDDFNFQGIAADINNHGQAAGTTANRNFFEEGTILRATVWRDNAVYELQQLLVDENGAPTPNLLRLTRALAINDFGQILVEERSDLSHPAYFVLTPVAQ